MTSKLVSLGRGLFSAGKASSPMTSGLLRAFSSSAASSKENPMLCFQCEQTQDGKGCTTVGVCGKTPQVASMQDLLVHSIKGISQYANAAAELGKADVEIDRFCLQGLFSTLTNVNFDPERFRELLGESIALRNRAKQMYESAARAAGKTPASFEGAYPRVNIPQQASVQEYEALGKEIGLQPKFATYGKDIVSLQELVTYGMKGLAAYAEHAERLNSEDSDVYKFVHKCMSFLADEKASMDANACIGMALEVGKTNYRVMQLLEQGHISKFGVPEPTQVRVTAKKGKCILISGHDLTDLEALLQQTEGKGINVYTHGEMLPANAYPGLKKYSHLAGNYGGAWQQQKFEFPRFPGPILMTTNCLTEPRPSYKNRIYTTGMVGWSGINHCRTRDFSAIIKQALEMDGFAADEAEKTITIGFGQNAILSHADTVVGAIKAGAIKDFYVIGGCDGAEGERSYFKKLATSLEPTSVVLTLGCGKYRFNKMDFGYVGDSGIPRLLDLGQCNDAYGALQVALALAKAFNTDVNSLPINYAISWFEQKAVAVLLTLLHLGVKRIHLGPNLPAFIPPSTLDVLVKTFEIAPISDPTKDFGVKVAAA